jgi:rhodanese-related sulfurtransferase
MGFFDRLFRRSYATISATTAREIVKSGGILVDVRTQGEWNAGHAPMAQHMPLGTVGKHADQLPSDIQVVTICHSGARSALAARTLAAKGFVVSSVRGGISAWEKAGGEIVTGKDGGW